MPFANAKNKGEKDQHLHFSMHRQNEPRREKTGFLHMRKQRRRSASR